MVTRDKEVKIIMDKNMSPLSIEKQINPLKSILDQSINYSAPVNALKSPGFYKQIQDEDSSENSSNSSYIMV